MGSAATKAKDKYNAAHYDVVSVRTPKGGKDAISELARLAGRTRADYIRTVIASHARSLERHDLAKKVGGGGTIKGSKSVLEGSEAIERFIAWATKRCLAPKAELTAQLEAMIEQL